MLPAKPESHKDRTTPEPRVSQSKKARLSEEASQEEIARRTPRPLKRTQELEEPRDRIQSSEKITDQRAIVPEQRKSSPQQEGLTTRSDIRDATFAQREISSSQKEATSKQRELSQSEPPSPRRELSNSQREATSKQRELSQSEVAAPTDKVTATKIKLTPQPGEEILTQSGLPSPRATATRQREHDTAHIGPSADRERTSTTAQPSSSDKLVEKKSLTGSIARDFAKHVPVSIESQTEKQTCNQILKSKINTSTEIKSERQNATPPVKLLFGRIEYDSAEVKTNRSKPPTDLGNAETQNTRRIQPPYPGEKGVIKFLELLPEDVRQHLRLQSNLTSERRLITHIANAPHSVPGASPVIMTHKTTNTLAQQETSNTSKASKAQNSPDMGGNQRSHQTPFQTLLSSSETTPNRSGSFKCNKYISEKRYITGAEIALAAIVSAAGIARNRPPSATKIDAHGAEPIKPVDPPVVLPPKTSASDRSIETLDVQGVRASADRADSDGRRIQFDRVDHKRTPTNQDQNTHTQSDQVRIKESQLESQSTSRKIMRTLRDTSNDLFGQHAETKLAAAANTAEVSTQINSITIVELSQLASYAQDVTRSRPKILISMSDTLVGIAERYFHDANLGWLIADLNVTWSKETWIDGKRIVEFKNRQQIVLPLWEDVVCFYTRRTSNANPKNLVTVVVETAVSRELLDSELGIVFGGANSDKKKRKPIQKDFK